MKLDAAIAAVRKDERELVERLRVLGERHKADHDVFHMAETLGRLHRANLDALGADGDGPSDGAGLVDRAREKTSELLGRRPETGLLLVRDLRELHVLYAQASIDWVILGQGAQAARDAELLETVTTCHAQTLRGMKWTVTRIKEAAPQALTG